MDPIDLRRLCIEVADDRIIEISGQDQDSFGKIGDILDAIGLLIPELTEAQLRMMLNQGGIDLTDWSQFKETSDLVTWYVAEDVLQVSELFSSSLVDMESGLWQVALTNDALKAHANKVKTDGYFMREYLFPSLEE